MKHSQPKATVEIGHVYSPGLLVPYDIHTGATGDTAEAAHLRSIAARFGADALRVVLQDDILQKRAQELSQDSWRWAHFAGRSAESQRQGLKADLQFRESSFEAPARAIIEKIHTMELPEGYRLTQDGRYLKVGSNKHGVKIRLVGYEGHDDQTFPSCEVLDTAWLIKRLEMAPRAITVLPDTEHWRREQHSVSMLAELLGVPERVHETIYEDIRDIKAPTEYFDAHIRHLLDLRQNKV